MATSTLLLTSSSSSSNLHSGWLQYHVHTVTPFSPQPNLGQLDGSTLPQLYFTLHSSHLSYSTNPALSATSPPLASIPLLPTATLSWSSPVHPAYSDHPAGVDLLPYVICLTECTSAGSGSGDSVPSTVHVLSAARRSDMEAWLTALRHCLFRIKRHGIANTSQQSHSTRTSLPRSSSAGPTATSSTSHIPIASPATNRPVTAMSAPLPPSSSSSLRQPLLSTAYLPSTAAGGTEGGSGSGGMAGSDEVVYVVSEWSDPHTRKMCCIIC